MARIATLDELGPYAGIDDLGRADQDLLQLMLDGAEEYAERWTGRTFSPLPALVNGVDSNPPVIKRFSARNRRIIKVPDLREASAVTLDGVAMTDGIDYWFDSYVEPATLFELVNHVLGNVRGEVSITGRWGFSPAPIAVKNAILTMAGRTYRRRDAMWADAISTAEGAAFFFSRNMPEEAAAVLRSYRTPNFAIV